MKSDNLPVTALYIALWGWQIIGIIFLVSSVILLALPRNALGFVFGIGFFMGFIICEFKSLQRKKEFYDEINLS